MYIIICMDPACYRMTLEAIGVTVAIATMWHL